MVVVVVVVAVVVDVVVVIVAVVNLCLLLPFRAFNVIVHSMVQPIQHSSTYGHYRHTPHNIEPKSRFLA